MILRTLLIASLLPLSAQAQLQLFEFDGTTDTAVGPIFEVGPTAPGDTVKIRFGLRNSGQGPVTVQQPLFVGLHEAFAITYVAPFPYILAPYVGQAEPEFDVNFNPTVIGSSFSATLAVNGIEMTLIEGVAVSSVSVILALAGTQTILTAGSVVDFGSVPVRQSPTRDFLLSNSSGASITVQSVKVAGTGFSSPIGLTTPVNLNPGQSVPFQIVFTPQMGTQYRGALTVDGRTFTLIGQGLEPPLPSASMVFTYPLGASAQQNSIAIPLVSASAVTGNGKLTMAFQPSIAGVTDDAFIQFSSGPLRTVFVTVAIGATSAIIGGQSSMLFQTGTTAGTITFTLTLENNKSQQAKLVIPPSPVIIETVTAIRLFGSLNVAFSGFDNTYSASQLAFTFYDLTGKALPQGVIDVDATSAFQQYFSATQAGGAFQMLATFPVTGNTAEIGFVTAGITNSAGVTTAQQIPIGN